MNLPVKRAAIAQLCSTASKHKNLQNIAKCANMAKQHGASMLFLPECFGFIGKSAQETLDNAEDIPKLNVPFQEEHTSTGREAHWLSDLKQIVETGEHLSQAGSGADNVDTPPSNIYICINV